MFTRIGLYVATFGPSSVYNQRKGLFVSFLAISISLSQDLRLMNNRCVCTRKHGEFRIQLWRGKVHQTSVPLSHVTKGRCYAMRERSSERASVNTRSFETGNSLDKTQEWII